MNYTRVCRYMCCTSERSFVESFVESLFAIDPHVIHRVYSTCRVVTTISLIPVFSRKNASQSSYTMIIHLLLRRYITYDFSKFQSKRIFRFFTYTLCIINHVAWQWKLYNSQRLKLIQNMHRVNFQLPLNVEAIIVESNIRECSHVLTF